MNEATPLTSSKSNALGLPTFDQHTIPNPTDYAAELERARARRRRADDEQIIALLLAKLEGEED